MDKYNQDSIIYSGPDTNGDIHIFYNDGKTEDLGEFHPMKISNYYSQLKGKPFHFDYPAQNMGQSMMERYCELPIHAKGDGLGFVSHHSLINTGQFVTIFKSAFHRQIIFNGK